MKHLRLPLERIRAYFYPKKKHLVDDLTPLSQDVAMIFLSELEERDLSVFHSPSQVVADDVRKYAQLVLKGSDNVTEIARGVHWFLNSYATKTEPALRPTEEDLQVLFTAVVHENRRHR